MKVNGNKIRQRIRVLELKLTTLQNQFGGALTSFEDEKKPNPQALDEQINIVERHIVALQVAQTAYNLAIKPTLQGKQYTLCELVKSVGAAGRREKLWRNVAAPKVDRYAYRSTETERDPTKQYAKRQVTTEDAITIAEKAAVYAADLREAIAWGNAQDLELEIDPKVFG